jgi:aspartyl aminopeptidase
MKMLSAAVGCDPSAVVSYDLSLYDTQAGVVGGINKDLLFSSRLDNLASCYAAITSLCAWSAEEINIDEDEDVSMVLLFDHEEVGSGSAIGAASPLLQETTSMITRKLLSLSHQDSSPTMNDIEDAMYRMRQRSFILSADMAHGLHPNYADRYDDHHAPRINGGIVIKENSNLR